MPRALLALALLGACNSNHLDSPGEPRLPASDKEFVSIAAGAAASEFAAAVDEGLSTPEKGPDAVYFVIIRAGDRHGPAFRPEGFHVVVGAGVRWPAGSLRVRRAWIASGQIDGKNEELETKGVSVAVERGAQRPFAPAVERAIADFCEALARRVPIHPDCVVAMQEVPFTNVHEADADERALARAARARVPVPPAPGRLTIVSGDRRFPVAYERRSTSNGRQVGMMMRKRFDGKDRGMLFEYPHRGYRHYYMRNCFVWIDLAFVRDGRIEEIHTMEPQAGVEGDLPWYPSNAAVKQALELPRGWFERNGIKVGDRVELR